MAPSRRDVLVLALFLGGLILSGVGLGLQRMPLVGIGSLLTGAGCAIGMVETHRAGVIATNWGTTRRADAPVGFRMECAFWWLVIAAGTAAGILKSLGILVK